MNNSTVPVKVPVLEIIHKAMLPTHFRLETLLLDALSEHYKISATEKSLLCDVYASSIALKSILEDCLEEAKENNTKSLSLSNKEFQTIISLAKILENASRTQIHLTPLWAH